MFLGHSLVPGGALSTTCACRAHHTRDPGVFGALAIPWEEIGATWDETQGVGASPHSAHSAALRRAPRVALPGPRVARGLGPPGSHAHSLFRAVAKILPVVAPSAFGCADCRRGGHVLGSPGRSSPPPPRPSPTFPHITGREEEYACVVFYLFI